MSEENKVSSPAKKEENENKVMKDEESEEDKSMDAENEEKTANDSKDDDKEKESEEDHSADDDEEKSDVEDEKVGIYDKPLVLEIGRKRERKKVERLTLQSPAQEEKKFEVAEGKGERLGEMDYVSFKLNRCKADELKPLHRVLFRKIGSQASTKKNIRQFSGFPFSKSDDEYDKRLQLLKGKQFTIAMIKQICEVLDVPRSGTKDEIIDKLMQFLFKPSDSGRKLPKPKRKRKSKGDTGKKEKKTKTKKVKAKKEEEEVIDSSDEEEEEEKEEEEEEEEKEEVKESEESEEEEEAPPPKKKRVSSPKKKPAAEKKKTEKKKPEKKKPEKKATPKKTEKKKKKVVVESSDDDVESSSSSDDDDEPLVKPKKDGPPSNDELKDYVKKLLDSANLEEVTMKTVLKDVYAKYPKYDLSDRKDFIKSTVKQIIS